MVLHPSGLSAARSSNKVWEQHDDGFKPWFDAHPNLSTEKKARRNGSTKRPQKVDASRDAVSSAVAAVEAVSGTE
jgi:hypothetical protein